MIGDHSAGAVMRARGIPHEIGVETVAYYLISVTDGDLVMEDGKSLEHVGVTPDEVVLPTAAELAARRDPVMPRALAIAGLNVPPDKAGALFPTEWRK